MITCIDCMVCRFQFCVTICEPFEMEQPAECPNCGSRYQITSINPLWYVREIDCQVRLSALETRQLTKKQQQELDDQAQSEVQVIYSKSCVHHDHFCMQMNTKFTI
jgi:hypothetical protein